MVSILFLDRDGVINRDYGYTHIFAPELLYDDVATLSNLSFDRIIIVTNQSGINRGYYTLQQFDLFMEQLLSYLQHQYDVKIDDYYYCPHRPSENCECRKPHPNMILSALQKYGADAGDCVLVGDKKSDVEAGLNAGININFLLTRDGFQTNEVSHEKIFNIRSLNDESLVNLKC